MEFRRVLFRSRAIVVAVIVGAVLSVISGKPRVLPFPKCSRFQLLTRGQVWASASRVARVNETRSAIAASMEKTAAAPDLLDYLSASRSEERRVGKECVSPGRSRWWQDH